MLIQSMQKWSAEYFVEVAKQLRLSLLSLLSAVAHAVSSQEIIHTKQNMNCTTDGVLYLITCTKSNYKKQYIGETGQAVYERQ